MNASDATAIETARISEEIRLVVEVDGRRQRALVAQKGPREPVRFDGQEVGQSQDE